jgi:hypothetical protein
MLKKISFGAAVLLLMVMAGAAGAEIPKYINFQGKLTKDGAPITSTTSVTFSIFTDAVAGSPIWTETKPITPNENGVFNTLLGDTSKTGLTLVFAGDKKYFASLTIGGVELLPRQQLVSVPFAYRAAVAESLVSDNPNPLYVNVTNASAISGVSSAKDYSALWGSNANGTGVYGEGSTYGGMFKGLGNGYSGYFYGGKGAKVVGTLEATKFVGDGSGLTNLSYVKKTGDTMSGGLTVNSANASAVSAISTAESYSAVWAKNEGKNGTGVYGKGSYMGAKFESDNGIGLYASSIKIGEKGEPFKTAYFKGTFKQNNVSEKIAFLKSKKIISLSGTHKHNENGKFYQLYKNINYIESTGIIEVDPAYLGLGYPYIGDEYRVIVLYQD